jgi:molybdopterin synthase sulfur carrier subunit
MKTYQIHYFGLLGERRGRSDEAITSDAATARELYESLATEHAFGMPCGDLRAAVNDEMVSWDHALKDGDDVAFLPPMSGG